MAQLTCRGEITRRGPAIFTPQRTARATPAPYSQDPLWWIWVSHTMYANRFDADDRKHRLATLVIMFVMIIISGLIDRRFLASFEAMIVCYAGSKYIVAMMYFVSEHRHKESVQLTRAVGWVTLAGATISLASIRFPAPQRYGVFTWASCSIWWRSSLSCRGTCSAFPCIPNT